jgi:hypothetical protein
MGRSMPALTRIVAHPSEAPQRAGLVASQMLGLGLTRFVLELPPVASMPRRHLVATIGATIERYLHGPLEGDAT